MLLYTFFCLKLLPQTKPQVGAVWRTPCISKFQISWIFTVLSSLNLYKFELCRYKVFTRQQQSISNMHAIILNPSVVSVSFYFTVFTLTPCLHSSSSWKTTFYGSWNTSQVTLCISKNRNPISISSRTWQAYVFLMQV